MNNLLFFQYCQKIVLFNKSHTKVLLARRKGEADYDGVYSFIGGKLETTDQGIEKGLKREKDEEIGKKARVKICPFVSYNAYYTKKDGSAMVLPHFYATYIDGDIDLGEEYSDYAWVEIDNLPTFEPKIETIEAAVEWAQKIRTLLKKDDFIFL